MVAEAARTLPVPEAYSRCTALSADGKWAAVVTVDGKVHVFAVAEGEWLHTLPGLQGHYLALVFSPDGALLAAADGRKESNFVTGRKRRTPAGIFLIHRSGDRWTELSELRELAAVALEEIFDAGTVGEFGIVLTEADNVFELAEE